MGIKAMASGLFGRLREAYVRSREVKLPGGVPLFKFLMVTSVVFIAAAVIMFHFMKESVVRSYKMAGLMKLQQEFMDRQTKGGEVKTDALPAPTTAQVEAPAELQAPATSQVPAPAPAVQEVKALNQVSAKELDERIVTFLLHAYEEQKVRLKLQEEEVGRLTEALTELRKRSDTLEEELKKAVEEKEKPPAVEAVRAAPPEKPAVDVAWLAELYARMKPDEASVILAGMEDEMLVRIFADMKSRDVAKIMALFDPVRAARISVKMTEKKQ